MFQKISKSISNFVVPAVLKDKSLDLKAELLLVFHNTIHGLSYNSLDCHVKLCLYKYFDSKIANKITRGRTKVAAIARNVLTTYSQEKNSLKRKFIFWNLQ